MSKTKQQFGLFQSLVENPEPTITPVKSLSSMEQVYEAVDLAGPLGIACFQIESAIKRPHQTVSARLSDLFRQGRVFIKLNENGVPVSRKTKYGAQASVYVTARHQSKP